VVADAPYGVAHQSSGRGRSGSAAELLGEAVEVWAGRLRSGGALGISWNTYRLAREELAEIMVAAGLDPLQGGVYERFAHRVDSSINRDIMIARRVK
jgi:tRNA G10  N-methylase Trm11